VPIDIWVFCSFLEDLAISTSSSSLAIFRCEFKASCGKPKKQQHLMAADYVSLPPVFLGQAKTPISCMTRTRSRQTYVILHFLAIRYKRNISAVAGAFGVHRCAFITFLEWLSFAILAHILWTRLTFSIIRSWSVRSRRVKGVTNLSIFS
jgi:hypothetical protein